MAISSSLKNKIVAKLFLGSYEIHIFEVVKIEAGNVCKTEVINRLVVHDNFGVYFDENGRLLKHLQ